jgi:glyoxylase-like metal-dependent hydrolase (beta-lactamase superfamily II)
MQVAEGIHRLSSGVANFYLIEEGGKLVLVDAGAGGDFALFAAAVAAMGRSTADLEAILLTHAHSDHTGFAEQARRELHVPIWIHPADVEQARGATPPKNAAPQSRYLLKLEAYRTLLGLLRHQGMKVIPIVEVSAYPEGEALDLPGRPRPVHLPGHTPGMCAIHLEGRRVVCSGDALLTRNPLTGRRGPQIAPDGLNRDSDQALASLDALAGLSADVLLPGHGEPWTQGIAEAVRQARAAGRS